MSLWHHKCVFCVCVCNLFLPFNCSLQNDRRSELWNVSRAKYRNGLTAMATTLFHPQNWIINKNKNSSWKKVKKERTISFHATIYHVCWRGDWTVEFLWNCAATFTIFTIVSRKWDILLLIECVENLTTSLRDSICSILYVEWQIVNSPFLQLLIKFHPVWKGEKTFFQAFAYHFPSFWAHKRFKGFILFVFIYFCLR